VAKGMVSRLERERKRKKKEEIRNSNKRYTQVEQQQASRGDET
jgi:hypothetical protein